MSLSKRISSGSKIEDSIERVVAMTPKTPKTRAIKPKITTSKFQVTEQSTATTSDQPIIPSQAPQYKLKSAPAVPPNWEASFELAIKSPSPFIKIEVSSTTREYRVLAGMMANSNVKIEKIERIINPWLWRRFTNTRRELLCGKSNDLQLLSALGLSSDEIRQRGITNTKCTADPYMDYVAILCHCTRNNVKDIFTQGLDERLSNNGLLGNGIYFTDDPGKATQYDSNGVILLFAVFLGDCCSLKQTDIKQFVREPKKTGSEKRNPGDLFFDSVVGKPSNFANEFVIYDGRKCYPIYSVKYTRNNGGKQEKNIYTEVRREFPSFAWEYNKIDTLKPWPLFAQTLFDLMQDDLTPIPSTSQQTIMTQNEDEESIAKKLSTLWELGFTDDEYNMKVLRNFGFNLERTIDYLIEDKTSLKRSMNSNPTNYKKLKSATGTSIEEFSNNNSSNAASIVKKEECPVCLEEFPEDSSNWKKLECTHKLCSSCIQKIGSFGITMNGISHTHIKCPLCQASSGLKIGSCPDGTMDEVHKAVTCAGYKDFHTIKITYTVLSPKYKLHRTAYLPATRKGLHVCNLLRQAWDRRLTFSIGTSMTTGEEDTLVWNIHHKTSFTGGVGYYGYPDPTYLDRVLAELKQYGIE